MLEDSVAERGVLYVVATPIGNVGDITRRAVDVLQGAAIIAAEDTRHSSAMLERLGIRPRRLLSLHDQNEAARVPAIIETLLAGEDVALVSDAGTPLVSDPGYRLVAAAHAAGVRVSPVPGACAAVAALSAAGLATDRFFFEGFLPAAAGARRTRLEALRAQRGTLVFYEAPHRIADMLDDVAAVLGADRDAALARELTKTFETVRRDRVAGLASFVRADPDQQRGEIVVLVEGAAAAGAAPSVDADRLLQALAGELPATRAARVAASLLGLPRRELYERLLALGAGDGEGSSG